jgi:Protein of unknown function (DUF1161)
MFQRFLFLVLMCGPTLAAADNCEALRAQIEAKIQAAGVSEFAVTVVPADAPASAVRGQVVGSCAQGANKIVYTRSGAASSAAPAARKPAAKPVLTECKDGSVSTTGSCKK